MSHQEEFDLARKDIQAAMAYLRGALPNPQHFVDAYKAGMKAKKNGWSRTSPYYEDNLRTPYWLAGFDGLELVSPFAELSVDPAAKEECLTTK